MQKRAEEFREILIFSKENDYSEKSAEEIFKLWNYIILPNEAVDFVENNTFPKFMEELKEANKIFTELQLNEREKIKLFHIFAGEDGENLYYKTVRPPILPDRLIAIEETKNKIEANKNKSKQMKRGFFLQEFFFRK